MNSKKRFSNTKCCVIGCHNYYNNTNEDIIFYDFPGRWYEKERRQIWINNVHKASYPFIKTPNWIPRRENKVCSRHFLNNIKSNNPLDPNYNPTIFPSMYKVRQEQNSEIKLQKAERAKKRYEARNLLRKNNEECQNNTYNNVVISDAKEHVDAYCQVSLEQYSENFNFIFICSLDGNCVGVQANIPILKRNSVLKSYSDKCVGSSEELKSEGFCGYHSIKSEKDLNSLCGVTGATFMLLLTHLHFVNNSKLSVQSRLLLFLMKIKLGLSNRVLGTLFNLYYTTCSRIVLKLVYEVSQKFSNLIYWPSREIIQATLPQSSKIHYPNCRVIIDCTEIKINRPKRVDNRVYTYSHYKSGFTAKFLVGVAPNGFVTFISDCYGGRTSDTFITNDSGILNLLESGDVVLADKGFPGIKCEESIVVTPPFVHEGMLTYEEMINTYNIASVRIHVERSIQRIKIYEILQKIPYHLFPHIDAIVQVCAILTNLQPPTMKESLNNDEFIDESNISNN